MTADVATPPTESHRLTQQEAKQKAEQRLREKQAAEKRDLWMKSVLLFVLGILIVGFFYYCYNKQAEEALTCDTSTAIDYAAAGRSSLTSFGRCY